MAEWDEEYGASERAARSQAAAVAGVPLDERVGEPGPAVDEEGQAALAASERRLTEAEARAAARAPRRLRLNVTGGTPDAGGGHGYVTCSIFQSDNGVNWACSQSGLIFSEDWFRAVFGEPTDGRRIEFEIANPHEVTG